MSERQSGDEEGGLQGVRDEDGGAEETAGGAGACEEPRGDEREGRDWHSLFPVCSGVGGLHLHPAVTLSLFYDTKTA